MYILLPGDLEVKGGAAKRREIGHGALAEKGLKAVVPKEFPFTIRVSAEVLESNGSSSMASVCAGSLALLDAGVPIKRPAAGVAMGLITKTNNRKIEKHCILTDILGLEDYAGDSDFKIAGTSHGFTALQADFKLQGVSIDIITEMTKASQEPLNHILSKMEECIAQPRDRKDNWPCTESISLPLKYRGKVKANMRHIEAITGVTISVNDDQSFGIFASNLQDLNSAKSMIEELQEIGSPVQFEFGNTYKGKIVELQQSGAYVELHQQMDPVFVRNSQLDIKKISHSEAAGLPVGTIVYIKYFGTDSASGEERWSRRALLSAVIICPTPSAILFAQVIYNVSVKRRILQVNAAKRRQPAEAEFLFSPSKSVMGQSSTLQASSAYETTSIISIDNQSDWLLGIDTEPLDIMLAEINILLFPACILTSSTRSITWRFGLVGSFIIDSNLIFIFQ
ncbi:hypothetical protein EB796_008231 [Bugula neritina]|uniref:polyribonucleotide nucleotidyltransferase n=1 Tax=Bugula neritina TaxID=10212 RepID=A0A7J7K5E3_BUGNE|nr:hypothetical protein EB796_008231 [Bugula neritina]